MLRAALFTTYDRADERLLVEHMLPVFLRLGHEAESEGRERQYFLLELDRRLKQLHDRLVVVSSTIREEDGDIGDVESAAYGWIWSSIRHLTVGRQGRAIQHAKLWLFHWRDVNEADSEYLEIVVSSANLTRAAFRSQIQGAWRALVKLNPRRAEARLGAWGVLPDFLNELGASAGEAEAFAPFIELLARADCPVGVTFLASVPGHHGRQVLRRTPWGAAGLADILPAGRGQVRMSILSPFVGSWSADAIARWCAAFSGAPRSVDLLWIDKTHPWAGANRWRLPESTRQVLTTSGVSLLQLPEWRDSSEESGVFHGEHRARDERWSHAKIYALQRGTSRRVLVTSANFSVAAWGDENRKGELAIENFELGVCVEQAVWPFSAFDPFEDLKEAATASDLPPRASARITWGRAAWDGKRVEVECRCEGNLSLVGEILGAAGAKPISRWVTTKGTSLRSARVPWVEQSPAPSSVLLTCDAETVSVTVFDQRPALDREDTTPTEVDPDLAQAMRDELLFEEYGGPVAGDVVVAGAGGGPDGGPEGDEHVSPSTGRGLEDETENDTAGRPESYAVPAFVLARQHLRVVDCWAGRVRRTAKLEAGDFERQSVQRGGELLIEAFRRRSLRDQKLGPSRSIGARLAKEELTVRLKHLRDG
jgi:hypothetical protein